MTEINYVKGDATDPIGPGNKIIVHVCNDIGGWGRGFVLAISKRWEAPEREYRRWARDGPGLELGKVQFVRVEPTVWIANLIGQHQLKSQNNSCPPIRYEAIRQGLCKITQKAVDLEASIHMPRIGCGLAGGKWDVMEPMIQEKLLEFGIPVTVYDFEEKKKRTHPYNNAGAAGGQQKRRPSNPKNPREGSHPSGGRGQNQKRDHPPGGPGGQNRGSKNPGGGPQPVHRR